jgi:glycerate-2-kinase
VHVIKNYLQLCTNDRRKKVLDLIEVAYDSIDPKNVVEKSVKCDGDILYVKDEKYTLSNFKSVNLLGIGKGSSYICSIIADQIKDFLTSAYAIDLVDSQSPLVETSIGTHPVSSDKNFEFTKSIIDKFQNLGVEDLVISVICGGGSSLFEYTKISIDEKIEIDKKMLSSGADIYEMNTIRKHLSLVKGGNFAKICYPAHVIDLIFSDVLGNDLSFIASGPLVLDKTTQDMAIEINKKYKLGISDDSFLKTPKDEEFFKNVSNFLILTNHEPLEAMKNASKSFGVDAFIYSENLSGIARDLGEILIKNCPRGKILLAGGETTVVVKGDGMGGRNQEVVAGAFDYIDSNIVISSFGSDGWDNYLLAGAIADKTSIDKARNLKLDVNSYLDNNNTLPFFQAIGDGIDTGKRPSNVSDLMIVANI